jgi:hypothetical protein
MESGRMRTNHPRRTDLIVLAALVVAGVLASVSLPAEAARAVAPVDCRNPSTTADADGDGFTDAHECRPSPGLTLDAGAVDVIIPSCYDSTTGSRNTALDRSVCLDPNTQDLFVILVPAATSLIPTTFYEFVTKPKPSPDLGLGITIHQIANDNAVIGGTTDRVLISGLTTPKAVRVTENVADLSSGTVLGQATNGTPTTTGKVVVWPVRILQHVNETRRAAGLLELSATDPIVVQYIKQVIAHEMGHVMGPMANVSSTTASLYGGKHYAPEDHVVMSQYVTNDGAGNFQIGDDFKDGDRTALKLK